MPLYNNVIRSIDREDPPDEGKLGYEFWNAVEELPIIKQIKDWNEDAAQKSEYLNERARSGKEGLLVQGMQAVQDTLGTVVGLPFQALEAAIQETSDRTNIDPRTFGAIKDIYSYSKSVKASKSGSFYKGVQVAKKNIPRADILNPGQITVKPITPKQAEQAIDKVQGLSRFRTVPQIHSYENRPVHIPKEELAPFQKGEPLMSTTGGLIPEWLFSWKGNQYDKYRSDRSGLNAPKFTNPQQARNWYAKVTRERVLDEVIAQGGTKEQADQIYRDHRANMKPLNPKNPNAKGGRGLVATISKLNEMFQRYNRGIQVRTEKYTRNGQDYFRWTFKDVDGKRTRWDFEREPLEAAAKAYSTTTFAKDHLKPVRDRLKPGGGYFGADNEFNFEILYQFVNIQKSNTSQLHPAILKEQGVPETFSEYINMKLYPQNYDGMFVPQRWKENFQKIVLSEYYQKTRGLQSANKRNKIMLNLVEKHSKFFKDPVNAEFLAGLEEELGQQVAKNMEEGVAAGNEVPAWIGLLQRPPGGWDGNDPWWNSLPEDAKTRYRERYNYKQRTLYQPTKERYTKGYD